jgi:hypothetical protein
MKKLLVLSALLGLLALPVFADHVTVDFGGDHTWGVMSDFGTNVKETLDLTWDVMVGIDDYNSFVWSIKGLEFGLTTLDKALVTTDLGMWLGLPVGFKLNWGYDDPDANEFQNISGYGNEEIFDFSPGEYWGLDLLLSFASFFEVEVAFDPDAENGGSLLAGLAVKEPMPGLNAEVYYFQNQSSSDVFDQGRIAFDAAYATEVAGIALKAGAAFMYDMADAATDAWIYGIGLVGSKGMFKVTVGVDGNETDALDELTATVDVSPVDMATIYGGLDLDLRDAAPETLYNVDLGVNAHIGLVEAYVGYLITTVGGGGQVGYKAPDDKPALADGGFYLKFDVNY